MSFVLLQLGNDHNNDTQSVCQTLDIEGALELQCLQHVKVRIEIYLLFRNYVFTLLMLFIRAF